MPAPVSGSTLSTVMEKKGVTNTKLAEKMHVTPGAIAYWKRCDEIPRARIANLVLFLQVLIAFLETSHP